jgi:hypothetical protein
MAGMLPDDTLALLARQAGLSADKAVTAVAIALAESSGNPQAVGDNGSSYGLWQVHWTVHPQFDRSQLFDPAYNASAMASLSGNGADWSPWTTYNTGAYQQYLARAQGAVQRSVSSTSVNPATVLGGIGGLLTGGVTGVAAGAATAAAGGSGGSAAKGQAPRLKIGPWDASGILWAGMVLLGAALVLGGIALLAVQVAKGPAAEPIAAASAPGRLLRRARRAGGSGTARPTRPAATPRAPAPKPENVRIGGRYYRAGSTAADTARYQRRTANRQRSIIRRGSSQGATPPQRRAAARVLRRQVA